MRVPDLDWPPDLFSDEIEVMQEASVVSYATSYTKPTLWADLLNTWIGCDTHFGQRPPMRMFNCEQAAL